MYPRPLILMPDRLPVHIWMIAGSERPLQCIRPRDPRWDILLPQPRGLAYRRRDQISRDLLPVDFPREFSVVIMLTRHSGRAHSLMACVSDHQPYAMLDRKSDPL